MKKLVLSIVMVLILLVTGIASCSGRSETSLGEGIVISSPDIEGGNAHMTASAPSPGYDRDDGYDVKYSDEQEAYKGSSVTAADTGTGDGTIDRMIVRTGNISLVVEDVTAAIETITGYADTFGGYVVSSAMWKNGDKLAGSVSFRVLAENFDSALRVLRGMAVEVTYENTSAQDVTEEYVELDASLENLQATRDKLLELFDRASSVKETLEVQQELTNIEGQIKQTEARMEYLEKTSSHSIIYAELQESTIYFEFSANKRMGVKAGEKLEFTVSRISGGFSPYSYLWDFGDGETSTEVSPTHSYRNDGYYDVSLTITDDRGSTETIKREYYVQVLPGWNAGRTAGNAWNGLASFGRGLLNALIWIGIFSPVWLIIGGVVIWLVRRRRATK